MKFITYNKITGKITRTGHCQRSTFDHQAGEGESVLEAVGNDVRQKIVGGKIVNKTPGEIKQDNPKTKPKPFDDRVAKITNKQLQTLLDRIDVLESWTALNGKWQQTG